MKSIPEIDLINAIEYAMRREPVWEVCVDEDGEYEAYINEAHSLLPFVRTLLKELELAE